MKTLVCRVDQDLITSKISDLFDYSFSGETRFDVPNFPVEVLLSEFSIGLIVGPSGSGKSSLIKSLGREEEKIEWEESKAVCSHFDSAETAMQMLGGVGLNSIPSWVRPYHVLSTGEQFRANLARRLRSGATIDEFTSVVDRVVAKSCCVSIGRAVREKGLNNIILATCHYDVIPWLTPDWVFDTMTKTLTEYRGLLRRPNIEIQIESSDARAWEAFSNHHYLSGSLNRSAKCFTAWWADSIVGFSASLAFPNGNFTNAYREHRTVILPDYQGLGIGVRFSDAVAQIHVTDGKRFFSKTSHPRMGLYRENSPLWRPTSKNKRARLDYLGCKTQTKEDKHKQAHALRVTYSHEYVGKLT